MSAIASSAAQPHESASRGSTSRSTHVSSHVCVPPTTVEGCPYRNAYAASRLKGWRRCQLIGGSPSTPDWVGPTTDQGLRFATTAGRVLLPIAAVIAVVTGQP